MKKYLMTPADLAANGILLGSANGFKGYEHFSDMASKVAAERGFGSALIGLSVKSMAGPQSDHVYPISKEEWRDYIQDAVFTSPSPPDVYVVDGTKFALPI